MSRPFSLSLLLLLLSVFLRTCSSQVNLPQTPGTDTVKTDTATGAGSSLKGAPLVDLKGIAKVDLNDKKGLLDAFNSQDKSIIQLFPQDPDKRDAMFADLVKKKKDEAEQHENSALFHAYGMQSEGNEIKVKWNLVFPKKSDAESYFYAIQIAYKDYYDKNRLKCSEHPSPQIFIFPHQVGPKELENWKAFEQFTGKVFYFPSDGAQKYPTLPALQKAV